MVRVLLAVMAWTSAAVYPTVAIRTCFGDGRVTGTELVHCRIQYGGNVLQIGDQLTHTNGTCNFISID